MLGLTLIVLACIFGVYVTGRSLSRFEIRTGNVSRDDEAFLVGVIRGANGGRVMRLFERANAVSVQNAKQKKDHHLLGFHLPQFVVADNLGIFRSLNILPAVNNRPSRNLSRGIVGWFVGQCKFLVQQESAVTGNYKCWRRTCVLDGIFNPQTVSVGAQSDLAWMKKLDAQPGSSICNEGRLQNVGLSNYRSPLETHQNQISKPYASENNLDNHRWRTPSSLIGLSLFLFSYGLLFISCQRFAESSFDRLKYRERYYWDLSLILVNWLCGWIGLSLMLLAPRIF